MQPVPEKTSSLPPFWQPLLFAFGYGIAFYVLQFFLVKTGVFPVRPSAAGIHNWDVGFYDTIQTQGYTGPGDHTGFFILFPLVWRITHLGIWGISLVNIGFFACGFAVLMQLLKEKDRLLWLLYLTLPSMYFNFLPYTEALFFLLAVLIMHAIHHQKTALLVLALFLISLVRATAMLLLPALLVMELLRNPLQSWGRGVLRFLLVGALPCLSALFLFLWWQHHQTGVWMAYFKTQAKVWGHTFSIPEFALSNIEDGGWRYHWLSALALFLCFLPFCWMVREGIRWLKNKGAQDANLVFGMGYLAMVLVTLLTFNPKYGAHRTLIMGSNRYVFASPFVIGALHYFAGKKFSQKWMVGLLFLANAFWAACGGYNDLQHYFIIGLAPTLLLIGFLFYSNDKVANTWILAAVIAFNLLIQLKQFQLFITPVYVD